MFYLKRCPRCGGDLYVERDIYGTYIACLQCGRHVDVPQPAMRPAVKPVQPVVARAVPSAA